MSTRALLVPAGADAKVATGLVFGLGCGLVLTLSGNASDQLGVLLSGAGLVLLAAAVLMAAGWVDRLALVLVSLPLPALYSSSSLRLSPAVVLTLLLLLVWPFVVATRQRAVALERMPLLSAALLIGAFVLATLFAQSRPGALRESVNFFLLLGVLAVAIDELDGDTARCHSLARAIAWVAAACGLVALLQMPGILPARFLLPGTSLYRATAGFHWPNEAGMFLALSIPFCVHAWAMASGPRRWTALGALTVTVLGLTATFSRGSWVALLLSSSVLLLVGEKRFVGRVWLIAVFGSVAIDLAFGGALRERLASTIGDWVVEQRFGLMLAGLLMVRTYPILGVGPGSFENQLNRFGYDVSWLWDYLPTAQNAYIQMAAETGIVGLLALIGLLAATFGCMVHNAQRGRRQGATPSERSLHRAVLWAFSTACFIMMFEWPFGHGPGQLIMLIAALGFSLRQPRVAA
jgi:putative inorganic carbon (hco3(-)) transporter